MRNTKDDSEHKYMKDIYKKRAWRLQQREKRERRED